MHIGALEEEKEQVIKNLVEEKMPKNVPKPVKEINIQVAQEVQSHKQDEPKEVHTETHHA